MSEPDSFELFPRLPVELRRQIWREAFSAPAVWFALDISEPDGPTVEMFPLQSTHEITQVCVESRSVAEDLLGITPQNVPITWDPTARPPFLWDRRLFWTDWDTATIHLGNATNALEVIRFFSVSEMALFKHISFEYNDDRNVRDLARHLKNLCPAVSTIAVFLGLEDFLPEPQMWPTANMARVLASIANSADAGTSQVPLGTPSEEDRWESVTFGRPGLRDIRIPGASYYCLPLYP